MRVAAIIVLFAALAAVAGCGSDGAEPLGGDGGVLRPREAERTAGWDSGRPVSGGALKRAGDEFRRGATLQRWGYLQGDFGPNRFRVRAGVLELRPARGAWRGGARSFLLYRDVTGDFDARARVHVSGRARSGLLVRARPAGARAAEDWVALLAGRRGVEAVGTRDGRSRSFSRRARGGWVRLRAVRRGQRLALYRGTGRAGWSRRRSYVRADLPGTLQVGIAASGDGLAAVDWVRMSAPR